MCRDVGRGPGGVPSVRGPGDGTLGGRILFGRTVRVLRETWVRPDHGRVGDRPSSTKDVCGRPGVRESPDLHVVCGGFDTNRYRPRVSCPDRAR